MGGEEITEEIAKEAMRLAQYKLPVKTKFISSDKNVSSDSSVDGKLEKESIKEVKKWKTLSSLKNLKS